MRVIKKNNKLPLKAKKGLIPRGYESDLFVFKIESAYFSVSHLFRRAALLKFSNISVLFITEAQHNAQWTYLRSSCRTFENCHLWSTHIFKFTDYYIITEL